MPSSFPGAVSGAARPLPSTRRSSATQGGGPDPRTVNVLNPPRPSSSRRKAMVKIFLDTANIDEIREAASWGVVDGVTTNPTLVAKTGRKWSEVIQDILALVDGPISLEVTSTQADEMIKQGRQLAKLHKNVVVKIQMTTEGLKAIKPLSKEGVRLHTTPF